MTDTHQRKARPHYEGDPTLWRVMVRPKWIGALALALAVAGGFAWLGQWQLGHAITLDDEQIVEAEDVRPIADVTGPGEVMTDSSGGMTFSTQGNFVAGDFDVIEGRNNGGQVGSWVVGHLETTDAAPGHIAVAIGWAPTTDAAKKALDEIERDVAETALELAIEGRYMPSDAPVRPASDQSPSLLLSMVPAQLVNLWQPYEGSAYAGYLVLHPAGELSSQALSEYGLDVIDSVPPMPVETVNWLNVFYAIEWIVFAGFAVFFWYRLTRDDWERIHELKLTEPHDA